MSEEKKLHIDEDWKAQVEAEKAAASKSTSGESPVNVEEASTGDTPTADAPADAPNADDANDPEMPPASFGMLMSSLATEALLSLGQFPHPATGELSKRPNQAKYLIDTLDMLKQKTAGNLAPEESAALEDVLHQLRMAFVASK